MKTENMEGYRSKKRKGKNKKWLLPVCLDEVEGVHNGRQAHHTRLNPFYEVLSVFLLCARMRFMQLLNRQKSH